MARALVTGAAGFIGSHLTDALLAAGRAVRGVDAFTGNYARADKAANLATARTHPAFELVTGDLAGLDLPALLEGCDVVFHLAGEPGVHASWDRCAQRNVAATERLLEALAGFPGTRLVYASSSSVYGNALTLPTAEDVPPRPLTAYGLSKLAAERRCLRAGGVALRFFSVYGPRQRPDMVFRRFCDATVAGRPVPVHGDGRQSRDFTFVGDVVTALQAAEHAEPGRVFNVGGGAGVSVNRALELLAALAGRPLDVRYTPRPERDVHATCADTARARAELGWAPRTELREGLAAELAWVRERTAGAEALRSLSAS